MPRGMWLDVAMNRVKIADLKDHLSEYLRAVEGGAEVTVTDRSRPIARISPIPASATPIRLMPPTVDFATVRDRARLPADWPVDSSRMLHEERSDR